MDEVQPERSNRIYDCKDFGTESVGYESLKLPETLLATGGTIREPFHGASHQFGNIEPCQGANFKHLSAAFM
jgi:hypothetical protein